MEDDTRLKTIDDRLTGQCKILEGLTTSCRKLNNIEAGIRETLELILERLNSIERRSTPVLDLNCDETGCSVCSVECYIHIILMLHLSKVQYIVSATSIVGAPFVLEVIHLQEVKV